MSVVEGPIQPDRTCPYSGETILSCKRSDLCDCFDFPEHDRVLGESRSTSGWKTFEWPIVDDMSILNLWRTGGKQQQH